MSVINKTEFYLNRSIHVCSDERILISFPATDNAYADTMDILAPMSWDLVSRWEKTRVGKRGQDYELFKKEYAFHYLSLADKAVPGISGKVRRYWTSSPLTYRDYTGTPHGSAYGIKKDCKSPLTTFLSPRTPISNLLMTGHNIAIHGIVGVLFAARENCAGI